MTWVAETHESKTQSLLVHDQVIVQFLLPTHTHPSHLEHCYIQLQQSCQVVEKDRSLRESLSGFL